MAAGSRFLVLTVGVVLVAASSGCYAVDIADGEYLCGPGGACPGGFVCQEPRCVRPGESAMDASVIDVAVADDRAHDASGPDSATDAARTDSVSAADLSSATDLAASVDVLDAATLTDLGATDGSVTCSLVDLTTCVSVGCELFPGCPDCSGTFQGAACVAPGMSPPCPVLGCPCTGAACGCSALDETGCAAAAPQGCLPQLCPGCLDALGMGGPPVFAVCLNPGETPSCAPPVTCQTCHGSNDCPNICISPDPEAPDCSAGQGCAALEVCDKASGLCLPMIACGNGPCPDFFDCEPVSLVCQRRVCTTDDQCRLSPVGAPGFCVRNSISFACYDRLGTCR